MTRPSGSRPSSRPSPAATLAKLAGVLLVVAVLGAGLLLPYVGGIGLLAKSESDKFLNSTCDLQETAPPQGTTFYASDGTTVLATIFKQDRKPVDISQMPKFLQQALVDTEDRRFYQHHGVDMRGLIRSAFSTGSGDTQGGSTLTMQYVKQERLYQAGDNVALQQAAISQTLNRKIQDAKCAIDLEKRESKPQILENYLNIAYFGENSYSIESAAETYFNVTTAKLTLPEAATLVGLLRAPGDYDPFQYPAASKQRRNEVIQNMVTSGDLTQAQATTYEATPLKTFSATPPAVTQGCYNAPAGIANVGFFCDYVQSWLQNTQGLSSTQIAQGGYKVVTTLNAGLQNSAQKSLQAAFPANALGTTAVLPVVDPKTGNVLAMASNQYYGLSTGQISNQIFTDYNANGASTYKYFTMIAALKAGITPTFNLTNNSADKKSYNPTNCATGTAVTNNTSDQNVSYSSSETLQTAIAKSSNTYFVGLEDQLFGGCDLAPIVNTAVGLGMNGLNQVDAGADGTGKKTYAQEIEAYRQWSLTLGEYPTSPLEITGAYAAADNDGTYCTPAPVLSITDEKGQPVAVKRTPCTVQMTPQVARTALSLLTGVTKPGGDSAKVFSNFYRSNSSPIAGKTGTDSAIDPTTKLATLNSSFWFVGMTPNLVATMALINVSHPTAPAANIPGYTDAVASTQLDGSVAAQFWLDALQPSLAGQNWTFPASTAIAGSKTVPNVIGQGLAAATTTLTNAGYSVVNFPSTCGSPRLIGQVGYYSPQTAAPGTPITVCTSNYQTPLGSVPIPVATKPKTSTTPTGTASPGGRPTTPVTPVPHSS